VDHDRLCPFDFQLLLPPLVAREFYLDRPIPKRRT
jgi:hypothetical protein